jgi:hypothetical protein
MAGWIDDHVMYQAANDMADAFRAMYEDTAGATVGDAGNAAIEAAERHCKRAVALNPAEIEAEYNRMFTASRNIGENSDAVAGLRLSGTHLNPWVGDAAKEFKEQLTKMELFCDDQATILRDALLGVAGAYAAAVEARRGLHRLFTGATTAANNVLAQHQQQEDQAKVASVLTVVAGVLTLGPGAIGLSVAATVVEATKEFIPVGWPSGDADAVATAYNDTANEWERSLGDGMRSLAAHFRNRRNDADEKPSLFEPLPSYCDVSSPDFSYDKFMDGIHVQPASVGASVDAERKKYADEHTDGEIDRRLNPGPQGDKGAV